MGKSMNIMISTNENSLMLLSKKSLSTLCWSVVGNLLGFFCLTQLAVVLLFAVNLKVTPFVVPAALILSMAGGYWLAKREGLCRRYLFSSLAISLIIVGISMFAANAFYDMSWDGLWYHQTAVYQMSHGWNPLHDTLHDFSPHLRDWLRYYAKGPWYIALALFETTHNIEIAKATALMAIASTFLAGFALLMDLGLNKLNAVVIATLIALNPVITCEMVSYLVDGLMISFLCIFIAAMIRWFRRPTLPIVLIAMMSAILCINSKFTGLVYLCFFIVMGGIQILIKERKRIRIYMIIQSGTIIVGILIFGWNPYVTNTIYRGNPFYPMLGSSEYPSLSAMGQDPIELYETPHNMTSRNRFTRFGYALFGRPGAQPFFRGENAILMWPFDVGWKDFDIFYFHEVRISGFGPLFSGAFILGLFLLALVLFHTGTQRLFIILLCAAIVLSLLISTHTWWARYGPQLWLLPIVAIVTGFTVANSRVVFWSTRILVAIMLINAVFVVAAHFRWEANATQTTNEQLSLLRQSGDVEIDFQYFREPFSERLRRAGVTFHATHHFQCANPMELMSVAPGYPGAVRACIK